jgi:hypothetical protein
MKLPLKQIAIRLKGDASSTLQEVKADLQPLKPVYTATKEVYQLAKVVVGLVVAVQLCGGFLRLQPYFSRL